MSISFTFFAKMYFECVDQGDGFYNLNLIGTTAVKWKCDYWVLKYNFLKLKIKKLVSICAYFLGSS